VNEIWKTRIFGRDLSGIVVVSLFPSFSEGRCEGKRAKKAPCRAQLRERESCCERGIGVGVFCCCFCLLFPLQSSSRGARNTQESFVLFLCS
jgi:hypothetical protein